MEIKITEKYIGNGNDYIYIGFGERAEVCYTIQDIEISWEWYGGDREHGCVYGRGYSFEELNGFDLTDETFLIDGEECSEAEFLKVAGITLKEFEALRQDIAKLVANEIEAEINRNPERFIPA